MRIDFPLFCRCVTNSEELTYQSIWQNPPTFILFPLFTKTRFGHTWTVVFSACHTTLRHWTLLFSFFTSFGRIWTWSVVFSTCHTTLKHQTLLFSFFTKTHFGRTWTWSVVFSACHTTLKHRTLLFSFFTKTRFGHTCFSYIPKPLKGMNVLSLHLAPYCYVSLPYIISRVLTITYTTKKFKPHARTHHVVIVVIIVIIAMLTLRYSIMSHACIHVITTKLLDIECHKCDSTKFKVYS